MERAGIAVRPAAKEAPQHFCFQVFGVRADVWCDDELGFVVAHMYGRCRVGADTPADGLAVRVNQTSNGWWIENHDPEEIDRLDLGATAHDLTAKLTDQLVATVVDQCGYLALRGVVLERDGLALAIGGGSGTGKSSLAAHLLARGWRLVSDEYAVVRPDDHRVVPCQKLMTFPLAAIELVPHSFRRALERSPWYARAEFSDIVYFGVDPAASYGAGAWSSGGRLQWLLLAQRGGIAAPQLRDVDHMTAVGDIQPLMRNARSAAAFAGMMDVLESVRIGFVNVGDSIATADLIATWTQS